MSDTITQIQARPQYIQEYDEALLARIFGTPDEEGVLTGGLIDDPELFRIPEYVQAGSGLQEAVAATLGTPEARQAFMDRYQPYFTDEAGRVRYLPEAGAGLEAGLGTITTALQDYFPTAKQYLTEGRGGVDAAGIYGSELADAKLRADLATGEFDARTRADALLSDARGAITGGLGQFVQDPDAYALARQRAEEGMGGFAVDEAALRRGTGEFEQTGGLADARAAVKAAGEGQFGAREAFERGTGRAFQLAEEGLGRFDPAARTQEFMDPYKEQVVDAALKRIEREGAQRRQAGAAKAVGAGAFGGSRAGVQAAETERAIEEAKQSTVANLMSQGYDKAIANAIATDEAARKRALQASGLTGQLGTSGASLEAKAYEDAAQRGLAAATTGAGLSQSEEQMRLKAFEDAQRRTMSAEQQINAAKQKAFEDAKARGLTGSQLESAVAQAEENARQKAFEDASKRQLAGGQALGSLGTTQLGTEASAFEAQQQRLSKAADMYRSMGLSSAEAQIKAQEDEMKRSLEAGRLMGGLGQTTGALGGAQADIGKAYGALAGTSADIGRVYAGMQPADLGFMYELGGKERQYGQQYEDFLRQNELMKTQQALAPYSFGQTFLTGSPSASMYGQFTSQPTAAPNPFLSGVGAYATLQGMNQ